MAREKTYGPYTSMYRLQEDHVNFFSPGAMRFFNSRVGDTLYGGRIFVTSERFDHTTPRLYSIRIATADKTIEELSDFQEYTSSRTAHAAARRWYDRLKDILPTITAEQVRAAYQRRP